MTFGPGDDARADVSGDGKRIVFNRGIDDDISIHVMDADPAADPCGTP